jgi:putative hydrolase of the HAD superfamily
MTVEAVILDWGGTLTPWHTIDFRDEWRAVAALATPNDVEATSRRLLDAARAVWARARDEHVSGTFEEICERAQVSGDLDQQAAYRAFWEPSTHTDPQARPLLERLRADGIRVGVLSNTVWPRAWHQEVFVRDGIDHLVDAAVYTSEIPWTKPDPRAFRAAMTALRVDEPARCVFVGDRIFDDIHGANVAGMRSIFIPHSTIPADQIGHTRGEPDAVVTELAQIYDVVAGWHRRDGPGVAIGRAGHRPVVDSPTT